MDTVAHLQLEVEVLKCGRTSPIRSKPVVFTSTKVPKFGGVTSWDQCRQVFDAIVWSNGWDDDTVALQLLSHLNLDLLVPEAKWTTRAGLIVALTEHYGSLGRLADYRRQFERTTRMPLVVLCMAHHECFNVTRVLFSACQVFRGCVWYSLKSYNDE